MKSTISCCCSLWLCIILVVVAAVDGFVFQTTKTTIQKSSIPSFLLRVGVAPFGRRGFPSQRTDVPIERHDGNPLRGGVYLSKMSSTEQDDYSNSDIERIPPQTATRTSSSLSSSLFFSSMKDPVLLSSKAVMEAAASHTQESCRLLGVKSIGVDYGLVRTGLAMTNGYNPRPLAIVTTNNTITEPVTRIVRNKHTNMDDVFTRQQVIQDLSSVAHVCDAILHHVMIQGNISRIIVGLPLHKNGTIAPQTNRTMIFATELARRALIKFGPNNVPVIFLWDERYTSKEAAARVHTLSSSSSSSSLSGYGSNHRDLQSLYSGILDDEAACIILENYYHENGHGAQQVTLSKAVEAECLRDFQRQQVEIVVNQQTIQLEREQKMERKRLAIARDHQQQQLQAERRAGDDDNDGSSKKKRKKKKKR